MVELGKLPLKTPILLVSIIIPVKAINNYIRESIPHILKLDYSNFEIFIFPDNDNGESFSKTKIIPTGHIGPAEKRDLAIKYANGEILAFLDDDAYPRKDWLTKALKHFSREEVGGVGGPAVTPKHDNFLQKISGEIFESPLCSGGYTCRYLPKGGIREVDDWPSVNLLVRKGLFEKIGGFDSTFWPGEDTKLCHDIVHGEERKIIYDPEVFVWHHRRNFGFKHFKQVWNYAKHRGYFAKKYPKTSLKLAYFLPTLFVFGLIAGLYLWNVWIFKYIYLGVIALYGALLVLLELFKPRNPIRSIIVMLGIFLTHITYGIGFLAGLLSLKLKR